MMLSLNLYKKHFNLHKSFHTIQSYNNSFLIRRKLITSSSSTNKTATLKGWRKHAAHFRSKPGSYIVSFAILHELTAIVPIPLVYIFLSSTGIQIPFPQQVLDEGNKFINKVVTYYGYPPFENGSRVALNAATSYAVVKVFKIINKG